MALTVRHAKCSCGETAFAVRVDADEQVALVTCKRAHPSLLLDSRDYWGDVIQDGRPKEEKCRCGAKRFTVALVYAKRGRDVRSIDVNLRCTKCEAERTAATFEIDYSPTTALEKRPLDPCPTPWLKAKQVTLVGYWTLADAKAVVKQMDALGATIYVAGWQARPKRGNAREAIRALATPSFHLYFAAGNVEFPAQLRDCWKRIPVIQLGAPTKMVLPTGSGTLYYLEWATETIEGGEVVAQDAAFLAFAKRVLEWMPSHFERRGPRAYHNAAEAARLRL